VDTGLLAETDAAPGLGDRLAGIMADLNLTLGTVGTQMKQQQTERLQILQSIYPVAVPAQSRQVTAGGALLISSAELLGPRSGIIWDVRRISVTGLASSSESVGVYKVSSTDASAAAAQNYVTTITGPSGYFGPGLGAFLLRAGESLMISGASLTASEWVTVSGDAISVAERWLGAYLL
jgi:hypothetical protein